MSMNYIYFFIFYYFLFFFGRAIVILLSNSSSKSIIDKDIFGVKSYIFYPTISLFLLGNLSVLFNFIFPMKTINNKILIVCLIILLLNLKELPNIRNKNFFVTNLFIPGILNISSYKIWLHYDAGLYHLNNQLWINESKVVFGLGNLNIWYSWSSIYEYISSYFWMGDNFLLLHFLNLIFFSLFYSFLYFHIIQNDNKFLKYSSLNIIFFGLIDNFGIKGGGNGYLYIQTIGKPDVAFAVLFYIVFILLVNSLIKNSFTKQELIYYLYFSLFAIQLKAFGLYLVPLLIFYFYKLGNPFKLLKKLKLFYLISLSWLLKNFMITGCLFFPFEITCFPSVSWYAAGRGNFARKVLSEQHYALTFEDPFFTWFNTWINHGKNFQIYSNFLISFIILIILNYLLLKRSKPNLGINVYWIRFYQIIIILSWILTAPNSRFGMIVCLIMVSIISINFKETKLSIKIFNNKIIPLFLLFICILLTPRFYSYENFLKEPLVLSKIEAPSQTYVESENNWAVYPANGDNRCWINIDCMDIDRNVYIEKINNYKILRSEVLK